MSGRDEGPLWFQVMLTAACVAGVVMFAAARSWVTMGIALVGAIGGVLSVRRLRRGADGGPGLTRPVASRRGLRLRGVVILLVFGLLAAVSTVLLTRADGNWAAYVVFGVMLAISLYAVGATLLLWRTVFGGRRD
ncbi:hypothetical protein [Micromonospora siamensis]|uniref:Transmembrane protein n=1 Tax=Micromonospora siamensis TaxID=299152 RepID=A0A1C5JBM1_9ACTN|nr:hypothetical protein [Micromonospora siamensis]SCG67994.1 hypothetical protein GA0074704_4339 [Micromonospora siamensis]